MEAHVDAVSRLERVTRAYLRQLIVELGRDRVARWVSEESEAVDQPSPNREDCADAPEVLEVSDTDRAAARRIAKRLGIHVRGGR